MLDLQNEEELKKYFLSIGLSLKFKFSERINENISISDLYEKAVTQNIPVSEWLSFISQQLNIK